MRIVFHIPNDEPFVDFYADEPSREALRETAVMLGACAYTPEVRHGANGADLVGDPHGDVPAGIPDLCAVDRLQTR